MTEYDMPIEEQIKSLSRELHALGEGMRAGFDAVDKKMDKTDAKFPELSRKGDEQIALLKSVIANLRKRVEVAGRRDMHRRS